MTQLRPELEIDNLPNRLTLFRVLLVPLVILLLYLSKNNWLSLSEATLKNMQWASAWIFTLASITDFFDGYIARKRKIVTVFGSFLDPIADKFLTVSSLIMLLHLERLSSLVVTFLILREMYMTSLRLLGTNMGVKVQVSSTGKWKTAMQMIGIPMLMAYDTWWIIPLDKVGLFFIYLSSILSAYSAVQYSTRTVKLIKLKNMKKKITEHSKA